MPSLKALKNRIASVKSTRKITKAMQMVAAAKLRRAQEAAEAARPYAERDDGAYLGSGGRAGGAASAPRLLAGTGCGQGASAGRADLRTRSVRRLQLDHRAAGAGAGAGADRRRARR